MEDALEPGILRAVVEELPLSLLLISGARLLYWNAAAQRLSARLKNDYGIELQVLLRDHLEAVSVHLTTTRLVSLITAGTGEPFYVHVSLLRSASAAGVSLITVRELAPDRDAFRRRYGLSDREIQVVDLVLRGYGNRDIAAALGITPATTKKHLTGIFNKVGVDTRAQLISRLV